MLLSGRRGPEPKFSGERLTLLARRYMNGESVAVLAKEYNVSPSTVYAAFGAAGVRVKDSCERGSHTAETFSRAAQAVALAKAGKLHREIASALGLTRARCSQLISIGKPLTELLPERAETPEQLSARETVSRPGEATACKEPPEILPPGQIGVRR